MYCFRCGKKLPGREINCPDCDTPQKRRQRRHKRMLLGLFIFLSGAFVGSLFDTYVFKGEVWKHSILNNLIDKFENKPSENKPDIIASNTISPNIEVKMQYNDSSSNNSISLYSEKEDLENAEPIPENYVKQTEIKDKVISDENIKPNNTENQNKDINNIQSNETKELVKANENTHEVNKNEIASVSTNNINKSASSQSEPSNTKTPDLIATNSANSSEVEKPKTDEVVIVEEFDNGSTEVVEPIGETASFTETSQVIPDSDLFPRGNLVYKNVSLLEVSDRNSYHGFKSKKGNELVFASDRIDYKGKPTFQCFIKSPSEKAKATRVFEWKGNVWTPELTPDSNMIIFSSDSQPPEQIFLYDRKSKNSMALTSGNSKNMMPCISPDGKKIAFVSNRGDGKNRIYTLDIFNNKKVTQITKGNVNDREPRWTPDGKSIIFTRIIENMKISHIMKVDIDPLGEPTALVTNNSRNWMADISPDNKILAYTRSLNEGGSKNVIVLQDLKSKKEEILSFPGIYESFRPVWNSDCSGFVFHVGKKTGKCIYQANFLRE